MLVSGSSVEGSNTLENSSNTVHVYPVPPIASSSALPRRNTQQRASTTNPRSSRLAAIRQQTALMFVPERPVGKAPNAFESLKSILCSSWLNLLLVFIPVSWALHFALPESTSNRDTVIFVFSFFAIIPLAKLLAFATEELSLRVGQTLAGLLNATLGNAVELIVAIIALVKCELRVVQSSLVGSVLSNLLLVLGMCFFAGGLKYSEQGFGVSATQLNSSLLTVSVIAVLLPAAFHFSSQSSSNSASGSTSNSTSSTGLSPSSEGSAILSVSHGVAIILLFIYAGYLSFQLYSHPDLYQDKGSHTIESTKYQKPLFQGLSKKLHHHKDRDVESASDHPLQLTQSPLSITNSPTPNVTQADTFSTGAPLFASVTTDNPTVINDQSLASPHAHFTPDIQEKEDEDEEEMPTMSVWMTIGLLATVTVLVAITAEWLVDSIDGMTDTGHISKEFVGIILLPIVGNAAEHVTAVSVSVKDKLNLSLGVAVGSSIQIALFVIPFIVTLAWILGKPLTLLFDPYESVAMFLSVLTVNYVVQDGKSNWLEGFILMCLYIILAVTFWFYPGSDPSGGLLSTCS
ncbi:Sodium/calcium exchanger protein-domain-containing protein [Flammula alnicola]|nr:Sodium/calcium exchanger protein-domain-containing protein [Flammula alnicola]